MASSRHERPEMFRRIVLLPPGPDPADREVVRDDEVPAPAVVPARPRRALERPTVSIVCRVATTRARH